MAHKFLVHAPGDAVGVAVADIPAGERISGVVLRGQSVVEVTARDRIPLGHKVALRALARGERVMEYGEVIGEATAEVAPGQHVHVHNIRSLRWPASVSGRADAS
jgi:(2R)-sulfolactate sulfo-lyase subunit alpha